MSFTKCLKALSFSALPVFGVLTLVAMHPFAQAAKRSRVETHRFNLQDCGFNLKVNVALWERQTKLFDTYVSTGTKIFAEDQQVFIQAIGKRKSQLTDPAPELFDPQQCVARDAGIDTTHSGKTIRLQEVSCAHSVAAEDAHSPNRQHRLYGSVDGHWSSLGVGLFASSKDDLAKYKPALVQLLKTFHHQCPFEFSPLKTGAAAEMSSQKAADHAIKQAQAAASAAAETQNSAKPGIEASPALNTAPPPRRRREVPVAREWRMVVGHDCKFAVQTVQGKWGPDTFGGTEALIPIALKSQAKIFLTAANYFIPQGDKGAWSATTSKNCTLERRGTLKTTEGREAPLFLAGNCRKDTGFNANFDRKNLLYGYVRRGEDDADFMVLGSDDKALLLQHEDELIAIIESHTDRLPKCLNYGKK